MSINPKDPKGCQAYGCFLFALIMLTAIGFLLFNVVKDKMEKETPVHNTYTGDDEQ